MPATTLRRLIRLCFALALLSLLGACSGGAQPAVQPAPQLPAPALQALPDINAPELQTARRPEASAARGTSDASFELALEQGNYYHGAVGTAGNLALHSNAGELCAAVYLNGITYNGKAVQYIAPYRITITRSGSDPLWVGFADYKRGIWRFESAPFSEVQKSFDVYLDRNAARQDGYFVFALLTYNGASVDVSSVSLDYPDAPPADQPVRYLQPLAAADGTVLGTDVYLPYEYGSPLEEGLAPPPHPAILARTPYDKAAIDPLLIAGPVGAYTVVLVQSFRGRRFDSGMLPDSGGEESLFRDHAGPDHFDALDTVNWLEQRQFFNGKLAAIGPSALGIWIYQSEAELAGKLDFAFTQVSAADPFAYAGTENGCFCKYNLEGFIADNEYPAALLTAAQTAFSNMDAPYFSVVDFNPSAPQVTNPGFHESGWWDTDVEETIKSFKALNEGGGVGAAGNQWLLLGPWTHTGLRGTSSGILTFPDSDDERDPGKLPDQWDGILVSLSRLGRYFPLAPPANHVRYYIIGEQNNTTGLNNIWQESASWPPVEASDSKTFTLDQAVLNPELPLSEGFVSWQADPADPLPTLGGALLPFGPLPMGPQDISALPERSDCLAYETEDLTTNLTQVGTITVSLNVSTANVDTDIAVTLYDAYATGGPKVPVASSILRLSDYLEAKGLGPVVPDTEYTIELEVGQRAYNFAPGHRIGLLVANADYPRFDLNPGNGDALYDGSNAVMLDTTLREGGSAPSSLTLQVMPEM